MYPPTETNPDGKLRLLYEAFPLAFIVETAGGRASNGSTRILDVTPTEMHARTALYIGNTVNVDEVEAALR